MSLASLGAGVTLGPLYFRTIVVTNRLNLVGLKKLGAHSGPQSCKFIVYRRGPRNRLRVAGFRLGATFWQCVSNRIHSNGENTWAIPGTHDLLRRHAGNAWDPQTYFADMPAMLGTHDLLRELPRARKGTRCSAQARRRFPAPVRSVTRRLSFSGRTSEQSAGWI